MSQAPKPRGLGRGLSALLGDDEVAATVTPPAVAATHPAASRAPLTLPIGQLRPGKSQPRTTFEGLEVLVDSVKQFGLLQPILVRPIRDEPEAYEIIAGERRWRAAQKAQLHDVPVVLRNLDELEALQLALVENLQRADLSPIDEAAGLRRLISDFNQTQEEVAKTVGKSRPHVANTLAPARSAGRSARPHPRRQAHGRPWPRAAGFPLSIRDGRTGDQGKAQRARSRSASPPARKPRRARRPRPRASARAPGEKTADTRALEKRIEDALGLKASLTMQGGEKTTLTLEINDYEQLDNVVEKLTRR